MAIVQARSVRKRAELLRIATDMFLEQGYDAVSVEAIVQRAGGTKTNVYTHCGELVRSITQVELDGLEFEDALAQHRSQERATIGPQRVFEFEDALRAY